MSEWWTYRLADLLMFSPRTYYRLFELYNADLWPAQLFAFIAGLAILLCARRPGATAPRIAAALLATCWLWIAWAFFVERYAPINWAAGYFAAGFVIEALLLLWFGVVRSRLALRPAPGMSVGIVLYAFAVIAYPLLAFASGRTWRHVEVFAMAPDPTVVATLGLLAATSRMPWLLLPIPLLWCAISGATLMTMAAPHAWVAPAAAALAVLAAGQGAMARKRAAHRQ